MADHRNPVTCIDGCVIEDNFVYLGTQIDALDREEEVLSRMSFFDGRSGESWFYHDLKDWRVVSVCVLPAAASAPRLVCALSEEGLVEFYGRDATTVEKIPDAGLADPASPGYGYVNKIRRIGDELYVCGVAGQIYRRSSPGRWVHHDTGVLQSLSPLVAASQRLQTEATGEALASVPSVLDLADIAGSSNGDLYAVGSHGAVLHNDGRAWRRLDVGIDDDLTAIHCESKSEVWICGSNGHVFVGNAYDGFRNVSTVDDNQTFLGLTKFQGHVYLAASTGLFVFDGSQIKSVQTGLQQEVGGGNRIEAGVNALWYFGFKDYVRFDGKKWRRVRHPDNLPI